MKLPENIYKLRKGLGLSQEELAEKLSLSRQAVSKWESGTTTPDVDNLIELAKVFNITLNELLQIEAEEGVKPEVSDALLKKQLSAIEEMLKTTTRAKSGGKHILALFTICLLLLGGFVVAQVHNSNNIQFLENRLDGINQSIGSQMSQIKNEISESLAEEYGLITRYDYTIGTITPLDHNYTVTYTILPKNISENMTATLFFTPEGQPDILVTPTLNASGSFVCSATLPLGNDIKVSVVFDRGGVKETAILDTLQGSKDSVMLQIESRFRQIRASNGIVYVDPPYSVAIVEPTPINSLQSGQLVISVNGGLYETYPLKPMGPNDQSGDGVAAPASPVPSSDAKPFFQSTHYSADINGGIPLAKGDVMEIKIVLTDRYGIQYSQVVASAVMLEDDSVDFNTTPAEMEVVYP